MSSHNPAEEYLEKLGNKALIDNQTNIHVSNFTFDGKRLPGGDPLNHDCNDSTCTDHYSTASYASITAASPDGVRSYVSWDVNEIDSRTKVMMDKIIGFFDF